MQAAILALEKVHVGQSTRPVTEGASQEPAKPTLIVAPMECHNHRTCPEPITRHGAEPPSENVKRLTVLTDLGKLLPELSWHLPFQIWGLNDLCCHLDVTCHNSLIPFASCNDASHV